MLIENKRQHKANVENKDAATYLNIWTSVPDQTEARCQLEITNIQGYSPEMIISASNLVHLGILKNLFITFKQDR